MKLKFLQYGIIFSFFIVSPSELFSQPAENFLNDNDDRLSKYHNQTPYFKDMHPDFPTFDNPSLKSDLFHSSNPIVKTGAESWTSLGPEGGLIASLVMTPSSASILYAVTGTYPSYIFKSIDGGASWTEAGSIQTRIDDLAVDYNDPTILYAACRNRIYKSTDSGKNWEYSILDYDYYPYIANIFINSENLSSISCGGYIYELVNGSYKYRMAVYRSNNAGLTWQRYIVSPDDHERYVSYSFAVSPADSNRMYIGGYHFKGAYYLASMFRSTDGGKNWEDISAGLDGYIYSIVPDPVNPDKIYAGTYAGVFRSADNGTTWYKNNGYTAGNCLAVDPNNTNLLYASSSSYFYKSIDAGINWDIAFDIGITGTIYSIIVDHAASSRVFCGTGSGVFLSTNSGGSFSESSSGMTASSIISIGISPSNPSTMYIEFDENGVFKSTNCGNDWTRLPDFLDCGNIGALAVSPDDPDIVYALEGTG